MLNSIRFLTNNFEKIKLTYEYSCKIEYLNKDFYLKRIYTILKNLF